MNLEEPVDVVYIAAIVLFFALMVGMAKGCDALGARK